jgi:hypothetical protein
VSENGREKKDQKHGENCTITSPLYSIRVVKPTTIDGKPEGINRLGKNSIRVDLQRQSIRLWASGRWSLLVPVAVIVTAVISLGMS